MAIIYPIDMPETGLVAGPLGEIVSNTDPVRVEMRLIENQLVAQGIGGQFSALRRPGSRWAGRLTLPKLRDDAKQREWVSFLTALRGRAGRFNLVDRGWRTQLGSGGLSLGAVTATITDAETIEMQDLVQAAVAGREFWATLATGEANVEGLVIHRSGIALEDAGNANVDLDINSPTNRVILPSDARPVYYLLFRFIATPGGFLQFRTENTAQGSTDFADDDTKSIVFRITAPGGAQFSGIVRLADDETGAPSSAPYRFTTNGGAGAVYDAAVAWAQANAADLRGGATLDIALVENTSPWVQDGNEVNDGGAGPQIIRPLDPALLNPGHWLMLHDRLRMVLSREDGADKTTLNFAPEVKPGEIGAVQAGGISVEPADIRIIARLTENRGWSRDLLEHTAIDLPWEEYVG